jgi:hypothetical protein
MKYPILLARLLLVSYSIFLLLFSAGDRVNREDFIHILIPVAIVLILIVLVNRAFLSGLAIMVLFLFTIWYFKTWSETLLFLIVSAPLAVASILFFLGIKAREEFID